MSTNSQDQEIDLSQIGKSIAKAFQNIVNKCFDLIFFLQKKIIIVATLFILGVGLGYYLDIEPNYTNDIIVSPNFGSNEYLYDKIDLISAKLREKDKKFFKTIGIAKFKEISSITIEPINGVYNFVNSETQKNNFELIKLMAEDGDIEKIISDNITSKNYYLHNINIKTTIAFNKNELIEPLLKYLQQTEYFAKLQKVNQKNLIEKIAENKLIISQIDQIVEGLSSRTTTINVSVSEKSSLGELIQKKDELIKENQLFELHKLEFDQIVKEQTIVANKMNTKGVNNKMKLILPFLFIGLYLLVFWFSQVYKQQKQRIQL